MNRAPQTVQQKQHQRSLVRSESKNRSFNKEGFSTHGERSGNIRVRQENETSMFDKEALHTIRERSNNSSMKGKPGKPGKEQLPFFGARRFSVPSPQNYTSVSNLLDKATFHLYTIRAMTWLFNVIFSKYLRIKRHERRNPIVNPYEIEKAFLNLFRNKFDFIRLEAELDSPKVCARDNISDIRIMAAFTKHRPDSVVDCLKRYMSYAQLKDMRTLSASLKATALLLSEEITPVQGDFEEYPDSFWGLQATNEHAVHSSLNGNNGSWTGLDDVECTECSDGETCKKCCHHHSQRRPRGNGEKKPAAQGAARRVAEAKELIVCVMDCPGLRNHYHPVDTYCNCCSPNVAFGNFDSVVDNPSGLFTQKPIMPKKINTPIIVKAPLPNRRERRLAAKKIVKDINQDLFSAFVDYESCDSFSTDYKATSNVSLSPAQSETSTPSFYFAVESVLVDKTLIDSSVDDTVQEILHSDAQVDQTLASDDLDTHSEASDAQVDQTLASDELDIHPEPSAPPLYEDDFEVHTNIWQDVPDTCDVPDTSSLMSTPSPAAGPVLITEQSPLETVRFYLAGAVLRDSLYAHLTRGSFLEHIFSGTPVVGEQTMTGSSTSHLFGFLTVDSTSLEYLWVQLGFTKFRDFKIHTELADIITRYAVEERLVTIETSSTGRKTFGFKAHAESAIRKYLSTDHSKLDSYVKTSWFLVHTQTIAYGLQQAMPYALTFNDGQTSKFPVVSMQGNAYSRPTSSIGKQAVKG